MTKTFSIRLSASSSDNPKAAPWTKIHNPKWLGFLALIIAFVGLAGGVESQQAKKVPRIGYLSTANPSPPERIPAGPAGARLRGGEKLHH